MRGFVSFHFHDFELDEGRRQLLRRGEPVRLTAKQYLLLQMLIERRPNAVSKRELYDRLWPSTYVSDANLPSLIADLREALGDDAKEPHCIRNVHGFGYAFCAEASAPREPGPAAPSLIAGNWHLQLHEGETVIGRDPFLPSFIDDPSVSRRHASIVCSGPSAVIRDLDSKNGTFVGGIRIAGERELREGDVVVFGRVRLTFHRALAESTVTVSPPE
jgi:DNA-binding winged helix-turn-helix (wHTH) protein